jgi:hypothetical protein
MFSGNSDKPRSAGSVSKSKTSEFFTDDQTECHSNGLYRDLRIEALNVFSAAKIGPGRKKGSRTGGHAISKRLLHAVA